MVITHSPGRRPSAEFFTFRTYCCLPTYTPFETDLIQWRKRQGADRGYGDWRVSLKLRPALALLQWNLLEAKLKWSQRMEFSLGFASDVLGVHELVIDQNLPWKGLIASSWDNLADKTYWTSVFNVCVPIGTCNYMYNHLFHKHLWISNPVDTAKVNWVGKSVKNRKPESLLLITMFWIFSPSSLFPALHLPLSDNINGFFLPGNVNVRRLAVHLVLA